MSSVPGEMSLRKSAVAALLVREFRRSTLRFNPPSLYALQVITRFLPRPQFESALPLLPPLRGSGPSHVPSALISSSTSLSSLNCPSKRIILITDGHCTLENDCLAQAHVRVDAVVLADAKLPPDGSLERLCRATGGHFAAPATEKPALELMRTEAFVDLRLRWPAAPVAPTKPPPLLCVAAAARAPDFGVVERLQRPRSFRGRRIARELKLCAAAFTACGGNSDEWLVLVPVAAQAQGWWAVVVRFPEQYPFAPPAFTLASRLPRSVKGVLDSGRFVDTREHSPRSHVRPVLERIAKALEVAEVRWERGCDLNRVAEQRMPLECPEDVRLIWSGAAVVKAEAVREAKRENCEAEFSQISGTAGAKRVETSSGVVWVTEMEEKQLKLK
jgi:hypothetical protein